MKTTTTAIPTSPPSASEHNFTSSLEECVTVPRPVLGAGVIIAALGEALEAFLKRQPGAATKEKRAQGKFGV